MRVVVIYLEYYLTHGSLSSGELSCQKIGYNEKPQSGVPAPLFMHSMNEPWCSMLVYREELDSFGVAPRVLPSSVNNSSLSPAIMAIYNTDWELKNRTFYYL